ncbi:ATP-binding protein [Citricoccus sp. NPDC055426]|uniref:ATP-binding protein n=1 Tax=Citricoccus sp. NPDC055426 TaxID=3155536 RepID=UPI00343CB20D
MGAVSNPFTPGFGQSPAILAGRDSVIREFEQAVAGELPGQRNVLISGTRGAGKTVLLTEFEAVATDAGWTCITLHTASSSLVAELRAEVVEHLRESDPQAERSRLTGAGLSGVSAQRDVVERYDGEAPPLGRLLDRIAGILDAAGAGLLITLDELQSVDPAQLHEVTQHVQDLTRRRHQVGFVAAGIRSGLDDLLENDKTTFLRRAHLIELSSVPIGTAAEAIRQTVADTSKTITPEAAVRAGEVSQGYPYLIQLVGARAWTHAGTADTIEIGDVEQVRADVIREMVKNVHRPALREISGRKLDYLNAMLEDDGPSRVADIATRMGEERRYQSVYRERLIHDELIHPAGRGYVEFSLPYLRDALEALRAGTAPAPGADEITRTRTRPPAQRGRPGAPNR